MEKSTKTILLGSFLTVALLLGAFAYWSRSTAPSLEDGPFTSSVKNDPNDQEGTTCELGKAYTRNANHKTGCACPENYVLDTDIIGHEQCAGPGSECPILEVECVKV